MVSDKIKSLVIKTAGKILKTSGFLFHQNRLYFLGHYLEGSGKPLRLDERFYDLIRQQVYQNFLHLSEGYNSSKIIQKAYEGGFLPINPQRKNKLENDLYNSVGKFKAFVGAGYIYLEDYYEFYKWCGNVFHFKDNCTCELANDPDDKWSEVRILDLHHHLFKDKFVDEFTNKIIKLEQKFRKLSVAKNQTISGFVSRFFWGWKRFDFFSKKLVICISSRSFEVITFDRVFSEIGKPFYTFARIPFGEIK